MSDFETHPIGTGKRLAELEGLAFARRRTECGCTTDEDAIAAYRAWLGIDLPDPRGIGEAEFVRWRRVAEAIRDRLSGREMVAVAQSDTCPDTEDLPGALRGQPIDFADVRKGDRVRITTEGTVKEIDACGWVMEPDSCAESWYLLDRPDPEAELHAAIADALSGALDDNGETTCDWSAEAPAFVAALRSAGYVIEPAAVES